ncbi:MAG TPA: acyl-CoA dehydrogenase family protein [Trebonia sp.]|nr:acyl-CoA dehydrogenase family protein [Trebonia sp.]
MADLTFNAEQEALRAALSELLVKHASPERVRGSAPTGYDSALWQEFVAMGIPLMAVPEDQGGGGAGSLELALVAYESGRRIAPVPYAEAMTATSVLAAAGGQDELLAQIGDGSVLPSIALREVTSHRASVAPAGAVADLMIVYRRGELLASYRDESQPRGSVRPNLGQAPIADWLLGPRTTVLATGEEAAQRYAAALSQWRMLTAAALSGLAAEALAIGLDYVKQRRAFGMVIGQFQAIQHRLADAATAREGLELLAWEAAWARDSQPGRADALATMAFLFAAQTAFHVCREALQFHGGYGYTLEYDIQLYFRRAKAWPLAIGPLDAQYAVLADQLDRDGSL